MTAVVRAAGGVVWRRRADAVEVVLVHRPKYGDWTFPKGKNLPDEDDEACALREVEEETGLRCSLGPELPASTYPDRQGRTKVVRFWVMEPAGGGTLAPSNEVDDARWMPLDEAKRSLSYERDRAVLTSFSAQGA